MAHLSEREAVFARTDLLAATLAFDPGKMDIGSAERELGRREAAGTLHPARLPGAEGLLTTDRAVADERETIALMQAGQRRGDAPMRARAVDKALRGGPLNRGQSEAVKLILSSEDRTVGVQGYAGSGKTTMLSPTSPTQRELCRFSLSSTTQVIELLESCTPNSPQYRL